MGRQGIYDPATVNLIISTRTIEGFGDGTFIEVARTNPKELTAQVGSRGEFGLVKNRDRSGTISFILQPESESAIFLNGLVGSDTIFPVLVQRLGETIREIVTAPEAWIEEIPQKSFDQENPQRTWLIGCGDLSQIDLAV